MKKKNSHHAEVVIVTLVFQAPTKKSLYSEKSSHFSLSTSQYASVASSAWLAQIAGRVAAVVPAPLNDTLS